MLIGVVVVGVIAFFAIRAAMRAAYRRKVEALGWSVNWDDDPTPAYGLDHPPFGVGTDRKVTRCIAGTASGVEFPALEFRAFDYHASEGAPDGYVVRMQLPWNLPALQIARDENALRIAGPRVSDARFQVATEDADFAAAALGALGSASDLLTSDETLLAIDHASLLLFGQPTEPSELKAVVDRLAQVAQALAASDLGRFVGSELPSEMGVSGAPGWVYRRSDDSALDLVQHTGAGSNHAAKDVLLGPGVVQVVRLTHTWDTTRTETTTNSDGSTSSRTVTDHHSEDLLEYQPQFHFPELKVNAGWFGNKRKFESIDFNDRFTVRMPDPKLASDTFHPRMMRWFLETNPPPMQVRGDGVVELEVDPDSVPQILAGRQFVLDFFGRVPDFVWHNIGQWPRPVPAVDQIESASDPAEVGLRTP